MARLRYFYFKSGTWLFSRHKYWVCCVSERLREFRVISPKVFTLRRNQFTQNITVDSRCHFV